MGKKGRDGKERKGKVVIGKKPSEAVDGYLTMLMSGSSFGCFGRIEDAFDGLVSTGRQAPDLLATLSHHSHRLSQSANFCLDAQQWKLQWIVSIIWWFESFLGQSLPPSLPGPVCRRQFLSNLPQS